MPIAVFLVVRMFVLEAFHIYPSGSMERTLLIGDFLFVSKALYGAEIPLVGKRTPRDPARRDLVIFRSVEDAHLTVVKRVVGVPGDTLEPRAASTSHTPTSASTRWASDGRNFAIPVHVPGTALAIAFAVVVGVVFGWYPARRAARLDPIEAISGV